MPDEDNKDTTEEGETSRTPIEPATPLNDDENQDISGLPSWAEKHIRELRAESKSRRLALNDYETAQRKKDQKLLEEQGEYKKLADGYMTELLELRPMRDKLNERLESDTQRNQERIEKIPEQLRSIVPTDYTPDKLSTWLDKNANNPALALPTAPNLDAGAGGGGGNREKKIQLTEYQKDLARLAGMTEDDYAAQLKALTE